MADRNSLVADRNTGSNETLRDELHEGGHADGHEATVHDVVTLHGDRDVAHPIVHDDGTVHDEVTIHGESDAVDPEKSIASDPEKNDGAESPRQNALDLEKSQSVDHDKFPEPISIWHPSTNKTKLIFLRGWVFTVLILMTAIMGFLSIYWGALFRIEHNLASLTIAIVDMDGKVAPYTNVQPLIGPAFTEAALRYRAEHEISIGYVVHDPAEYDYDPIAVRQSIFDEDDWAAIIINANATALLQQAVATGNQSYDPLGAVQIIYIEARDQLTYQGDILPPLNLLLDDISASFGRQWIQTVLSNTSLNAATYSRVPQALNPGYGVSWFNLRPFLPITATATVTIGLIYLVIVSFFSFGFFLPHHIKFLRNPIHNPVHFWHLCCWKLVSTFLAYGFLSLAYSLISLAYQIPFSNEFPHNDVTPAVTPDAYRKASFVVYWCVNWLGMAALGLASENVTMIIGQPWTALWLVFWVITNVSTSFYPLELLPAFYRWGYAWPLYNIVHASRTIIFDIHSNIGLNVGVLCCWIFVDCCFFFPCCFFMRWKNHKQLARESPRSTMRYIVSG